MEIKDKEDSENLVVDHLSCLYILGATYICDTFPDKHLLAISSSAS